MKKVLTLLCSFALCSMTFSQVTSSVLLNEDFATSVNPSLVTNASLTQSNQVSFDGQNGVGEFLLYDFGETTLSWGDEIPLGTDSAIIEFKLDKNTLNFEQVMKNGDLLLLFTQSSLFGIYGNVSFNGASESFFQSNGEFEIIDSTDYWYLKKNADLFQPDLNLISFFNQPAGYSISTSTGNDYNGSDEFDLAQMFCESEFPGDGECVNEVSSQLFGGSFPILLIDDVKVTAYSSDVTAIQEDVNEKKEIIASYNTLGLPTDQNTRNEVIILKYSNGSSERIFNK